MLTALTTGPAETALERAAEVFALMSTVPRLRILQALCEREHGVGELAAAMDMPQPGLSQQLALLHRAGLLARRRQGALVYYRAHPEASAFLCRAIGSLLG